MCLWAMVMLIVITYLFSLLGEINLALFHCPRQMQTQNWHAVNKPRDESGRGFQYWC